LEERDVHRHRARSEKPGDIREENRVQNPRDPR
jgi:hypothetical protein